MTIGLGSEEYCGHTISSDENGDKDSYRLWECPLSIPVEVPESGYYRVEVVAWVLTFDGHNPETPATLRIWVPPHFYEEGDTWYRDMRIPGFADEAVPDSDSSLQWLAKQIVADKRFAEATVKFWWSAIMGSEVAEFPEDAGDTDFEGLLLAANAQDAEMVRLADGFRSGFQGRPYTYNLKDLLVEIVLTKWFRADGVTDADPRASCGAAGRRRQAAADAGRNWRARPPPLRVCSGDAISVPTAGRSVTAYPTR